MDPDTVDKNTESKTDDDAQAHDAQADKKDTSKKIAVSFNEEDTESTGDLVAADSEEEGGDTATAEEDNEVVAEPALTSQDEVGDSDEVHADEVEMSDGQPGSSNSEVDESTEQEATEDQFSEIEESIDPEKTLEELSEKAENTGDIFPPDPEIDAAVDDIVRAESDAVIAGVDATLSAGTLTTKNRSFKQKVGAFFSAWWHNKFARYGSLFVLIALIATLALVPATRYAILNFFGVRVTSSLTVIDSQTRLPLKNIQVDLQDKSARTDDQGVVSFSGLKLGSSTLKISKIGYADNEQIVVLGWGSNPLGEKELLATGEQFIFYAQDWLSAETLRVVEVESGESSARADADGKVTLTVGEEGLAEAEVIVKAQGYREERLKLSTLSKETIVSVVPDRKHAFVSNRNGQYDVYVIDVDGKNERMLLEATNKERETPVLVPHPTKNLVALISSRSGEQNRDGYLVDELFIIDTQSGEQNRIARSEQLQIIGWHEDTLVFWQVVEGTSVSNPERSKLISYNNQTKTRQELAAANYFNDVRLVNGLIYYAVSSYAVPQSQAKLFTIGVDGSNKLTLVDQLIFSIYRTAYDTLLFAGDNQKWFQEVGRGEVTEVGPQAQPLHKRFSDSPNGERTVWVEIRDGRGVLLMRTISASDQEERVLTLAGLDSVIYWLNDSTVVFRVITSSETADYVINVDKREERKIIDVTASSRFYY